MRSSSSGVDSFHHALPVLVRSTPTSGSAYCKCIRQPVRMHTFGFAFACDMDHKSKAKRRVVQGLIHKLPKLCKWRTLRSNVVDHVGNWKITFFLIETIDGIFSRRDLDYPEPPSYHAKYLVAWLGLEAKSRNMLT